MTHDEWLSSDDPWAMMGYVLSIPHDAPPRTISDRKLRLFAVACCRLCRGTHTLPDEAARWDDAERFADDPPSVGPPELHNNRLINEGATCLASWAASRVGVASSPAGDSLAPKKAALLRCVVGDPWQPATLCHSCWGPANGRDSYCYGCKKTVCLRCCEQNGHVEGGRHGLNRSDVLALAHAAYEDRPGRRCGKCHGSGTYDVQVRNAALSAANGYGTATTYSEWRGCRHCGGDHDRKGTGRTDDGALDPVRLMVLADALEEAGCEPECKEQCPACDGMKGYNEMGPNTFWQTCRRCDGAGYLLTPHPLLSHLRSPGTHVRGCWALDLVLGKE